MPSLAELVPEPVNLANAFDVVAARTRRRYPTREPDPASLAASQGRAATWEQFLPSEERAFQSAASLQAGGDYNPRDVFLGALGAVGAPASVGGLPAGTLGSGVGKGIKAYHGSPHDFEQFSMGKIGTGEGARDVGHGLYFAENPQTAQFYRDKLSKDGRTYEVNLNAKAEAFVDYDKPFASQLPEIQEKLGKLGVTGGGNVMRKQLIDKFGSAEAASQALAEAGIPGFRYLDARSRAAGAGSSNFVVFDDKLIDILRKYGHAEPR